MRIERYLKFNTLNLFLVKFSDFVGKDTKNMYLVHYVTTIRRYFYFSEIQVRLFSEVVEKEFARDNNTNYTERGDSHCFAFYALIRTCLEAEKRVSDFIQKFDHSDELKNYLLDNEKSIKNIIKTANLFVKHPLIDPSRKRFEFYQPGSLDISGNVGMYEWSSKNDTHFEVPEVNLVEDCDKVFKYLEGLAVIYMNIINGSAR